MECWIGSKSGPIRHRKSSFWNRLESGISGNRHCQWISKLKPPIMEISKVHSYYGNYFDFMGLLKFCSRILMAMTLEYYAWSHRHAVKKSQLLLAMNNFEFGIVSNHLRRQKLLKLHKLPLLLPLTFAKHSNILTFKLQGSHGSVQ